MYPRSALKLWEGNFVLGGYTSCYSFSRRTEEGVLPTVVAVRRVHGLGKYGVAKLLELGEAWLENVEGGEEDAQAR